MNELEVDLDEALAVAMSAAREAGRIMDKFRNKNFKVSHKGETDLVTEVDIACETAIVDIIGAKYPKHNILAEESEREEKESGYTWVIDPLDGTTNYAHGFPIYCSSVALICNGQPLVGAVYDPTPDEMFSAKRGGGAFLNEDTLKVSVADKLVDSLLATGFPYEIRTIKRNNLKEFGKMAMLAQAIRRPGAAALDLVYVAAGRLDGFWEFNLKPWDMAAGTLIVVEAGGVVSLANGDKFNLFKRDIVASNGKIHDAILEVLGIE